MADGSKLVITITAYEETPEREKQRLIKEYGEKKGEMIFAAKQAKIAELEQKNKKSQPVN